MHLRQRQTRPCSFIQRQSCKCALRVILYVGDPP
jgi:hypothetical protein